jgi:hypothetical protein
MNSEFVADRDPATFFGIMGSAGAPKKGVDAPFLGNEGIRKIAHSSDIKKLRPAAFWGRPANLSVYFYRSGPAIQPHKRICQ